MLKLIREAIFRQHIAVGFVPKRGRFQEVVKMDTGPRTFVTSDIHGCFSEFAELLDKMGGNYKKDRLIILGDYIDRGPQSFEVVKTVLDLQQMFGSKHIILLRGNHEQMAVDYYENGDTSWDFNENGATIDSFIRNQDDVRYYLDFFRQLPVIYQDDDAIYVHAGINPARDLDKQREYDLLWIRENFYKSRRTFPKTVIHGHTPTLFTSRNDYPEILPDRICIDTGCVYGGSLCGVEIVKGKVNEVYLVKRKKR